MTSGGMARRYIEEATGRLDLVRVARERELWPTVVHKAGQCVELFLKGALRLATVDPTRAHDVADLLRREAARFPHWFRAEIDRLAAISTKMAADRDLSFYGDEQQGLGPQDLFDRADAERAVADLEHVAALCQRLLAAAPNG